MSAVEAISKLERELSNEIKIAFGSMDFDLFRKADELRDSKSVEVLIYASHSAKEQPLNSEATWHGSYIGHVNSRNGRYPGNSKFRPASTATDKPTWAVFWEIVDLKPLTPAPIRISSLTGLNKKSCYNSRFIPERPLLIEAPINVNMKQAPIL